MALKTALGGVMRKIRKRNKKTQGDFAKLLGVTQPTISLYENGSLDPSDAVLLLLATMADSIEEKQVISAAMNGGKAEGVSRVAPNEDDLGGPSLFVLKEELRELRKNYGSRSETLIELIQLTTQIVREDAFCPDWLLLLMSLWRRNRDIHELWRLFEALPQSIKMDLAWIEIYGQDELPLRRPPPPNDQQIQYLKSAFEILKSAKARLLIGMIETISQDLKLSESVTCESRDI